MGFVEQASAPKRQRSCIGCAQKNPKQQLYRIVRTPEGRIAYVCSLECFEKTVKQGRLARSLKCSIEADSYQNVRDELSAHLAESSPEE